MDEARKCAVPWVGEIMQRQLYRAFGHASINQYAAVRLGFSKSRARDFVRLAQQLDALPRVKAEQGEPLPPCPTVVAPAELPMRLTIDLTPEQEARRAALVERLHKLGSAPTDRAELMLEALAALVEAKGPRGPLACTPPVQVHVHEDVSTGRMTVETMAGPRDRHRCRGPGCRRTRFLEVHHVVPREHGGGNDPGNLVTLCAACHRLWPERSASVAVELGSVPSDD